MADKVAFELVSPERLLVTAEADMVVVPGSEGDFAVLAGHAPMIATLRPGTLEVYRGDVAEDRYFVAGGFAEVAGDRLVVLAEETIAMAALDRAALEGLIDDAEQELTDAKDDAGRDKAQERADHLRDILASL